MRAPWKLAAGAAVVSGAILIACAAPWLAPYDPAQQNLLLRLRPPAWSPRGSAAHWLGTDAYGRDLLSRLIYGARVSLLVGTLAMALSSVAGTTLGMAAGWRQGWLGAAVMRLADAQMALPEILLAILVVAALGAGLPNLVLVLAASTWTVHARMAYGLTRRTAALPFVEAARAQGARPLHILWRHILPQLLPVLLVVCTLQVAQLILAETALSFLGLGIPPPTPSWGNILAEGRDRLFLAPWIANSAGLCIIIAVLGVNMLGDGLRGWLDPRQD